MDAMSFFLNPNSGTYTAGQNMVSDDLKNTYERLRNQTLETQMPGVAGTAQSLAAKGQYDTRMVDSNVATDQSSNTAKMSKSELEQMDNFGEKIGGIAGMLEQVPPAARPQAFKDFAKRYNLPIDAPELAPLMQVPPDMLPQALGDVSKGIQANSSKYRQAIQLKQMDNDAAIRGHEITSAGTVKAAGVRADATLEKTTKDNEAKAELKRMELENKLQLAQAKADQAEQKLNIEQRLSALLSDPNWKNDPAKVTRYGELMKTKTTLAAASAPNLAPEVMAGGTPTTTAGRTDSTIKDVTGGKETPAAPAASPDVKAAAAKEWGAYEPDKYEYGVNPATGKFARRPKHG